MKFIELNERDSDERPIIYRVNPACIVSIDTQRGSQNVFTRVTLTDGRGLLVKETQENIIKELENED